MTFVLNENLKGVFTINYTYFESDFSLEKVCL